MKEEIRTGIGSHVECIEYEDFFDFAEFSTRTCNILRKVGVSSFSELCGWTIKELLSLKNMGRKSVNEIRRRLEELNLKLKDEYKNRFRDVRCATCGFIIMKLHKRITNIEKNIFAECPVCKHSLNVSSHLCEPTPNDDQDQLREHACKHCGTLLIAINRNIPDNCRQSIVLTCPTCGKHESNSF